VSEGAAGRGVAVVVPASGRGTRLGGEPKQFRQLGDAPVLLQTLRALARCACVDALVVATLPERVGEVEAWRERLPKLRAVVPGGDSRQASTALGLEALPASCGYALVHDAARPFVSLADVERVVSAAREHGAAALAMPLADTLRRGADGRFGETLPRDGLWRMQTPQGARADWLRRAHEQATGAETDDVAILQSAGYAVRIVEGRPSNFKITTPADWREAQASWKRNEASAATDAGAQ
jgi:2-C-methyl-D-erythritol 4-phosphate cytidylyltransferase